MAEQGRILNPSAVRTKVSIVDYKPGGARKSVPRTTIFRGSSKGSGSVTITTPEGETIERVSAKSAATGNDVILERVTPATSEQSTSLKSPLRGALQATPTYQSNLQTAATIRAGQTSVRGSQAFNRLAEQRATQAEQNIPSGRYRVQDPSGLSIEYSLIKPYQASESYQRDTGMSYDPIARRDIAEKALYPPPVEVATYSDIGTGLKSTYQTLFTSPKNYYSTLRSGAVKTGSYIGSRVIQGYDYAKGYTKTLSRDRSLKDVKLTDMLRNAYNAPVKIAAMDRSVSNYVSYTAQRYIEAPRRETLKFSEGFFSTAVVAPAMFLYDVSPFTSKGIKIPLASTAATIGLLSTSQGRDVLKSGISQQVRAEPVMFAGQLAGVVATRTLYNRAAASRSIEGLANAAKSSNRVSYYQRVGSEWAYQRLPDPVGSAWNKPIRINADMRGFKVQLGNKQTYVLDTAIRGRGERYTYGQTHLYTKRAYVDINKILKDTAKTSNTHRAVYQTVLHEAAHSTGFDVSVGKQIYSSLSKIQKKQLYRALYQYPEQHMVREAGARYIGYNKYGLAENTMRQLFSKTKTSVPTSSTKFFAYPKGTYHVKYTDFYRTSNKVQSTLLGGYITPEKASRLSRNPYVITQRTTRGAYTDLVTGKTRYAYKTRGIEIKSANILQSKATSIKPLKPNKLLTKSTQTRLTKPETIFLKRNVETGQISQANIRIKDGTAGIYDDLSKKYLELSEGGKYRIGAIYPQESVSYSQGGILLTSKAGKRYLFGDVMPSRGVSVTYAQKSLNPYVLPKTISKVSNRPPTQPILKTLYGQKTPRTSVITSTSQSVTSASTSTGTVTQTLPQTVTGSKSAGVNTFIVPKTPKSSYVYYEETYTRPINKPIRTPDKQLIRPGIPGRLINNPSLQSSTTRLIPDTDVDTRLYLNRKPMEIFRSSNIQEQRVRVIPQSKGATNVRTATKQEYQQVSDSILKSETITETTSRTRTGIGSLPTPKPFIYKPKRFGRSPRIEIPRFKAPARVSPKSFRRPFSLRAYTPTAFAKGFNIRGRSTRAGVLTGLGTRPITDDKKKKKRGRR